jgi:branched-chain amino acid transport system substrate-binding protein
MKLKSLALATVAILSAAVTAAHAQFSDDVIKVGVLTDMSGPFADVSGNGSVEAAKMAIEKLGGQIAGKKVELVFADHQIARAAGKPLIISGAAASDITGSKCSPLTVHWTYDTWALANTTANAIIANGGKDWFFLTADYAFGQAIQRDVSALVEANGGQVVGAVRHPLNTSDFSSFILQAQSSPAQIIGLANAGADTANSIKQAAEFGLTGDGKQLAGLLITIPDIHAIGLKDAQGLLFAGAFYWNRTPETRAFSEELARRNNDIHPDMIQAGVYSSLLHYAKAVEKAGTDDGVKVVEAMKEIPTDDPLFGKGMVRADGRKIHPMYLFQVKSPEQSKEPWDYYNVINEVSAEEAFRPMKDGGCELVK